MNRRALLVSIAGLAIALPALAQAVDVSAINAYLQSLRTAGGRFRQINPDGSSQDGGFFLARPGRIRFDYDQPKGAMVIADGINVAVFDPKSNRNPTRYPLGRTPLAILLRDRISLAEPGLVLGAVRTGEGIDITVVDPRSPDSGRMVMTFSESPVVLRQWAILTRTGQRTEVRLTDLKEGIVPDRSLFNIELATVNLR